MKHSQRSPAEAAWAGLNTPIVTGRIEILRRVGRQFVFRRRVTPSGAVDSPAAIDPAVAAGPAEPANAARLLKLNSVVDQTLEGVVNSLEPAKVHEFRAYASTMGAEPSGRWSRAMTSTAPWRSYWRAT